MLVFGGFNPSGITKNSFDKGLLGELYLLDLMKLKNVHTIVNQHEQEKTELGVKKID